MKLALIVVLLTGLASTSVVRFTPVLYTTIVPPTSEHHHHCNNGQEDLSHIFSEFSSGTDFGSNKWNVGGHKNQQNFEIIPKVQNTLQKFTSNRPKIESVDKRVQLTKYIEAYEKGEEQNERQRIHGNDKNGATQRNQDEIKKNPLQFHARAFVHVSTPLNDAIPSYILNRLDLQLYPIKWNANLSKN